MMRRALDYSNTPPLQLPLRFLLPAPWFGAAAGIVAMCGGGATFSSRWAPPLLAATHLITLGCLALAMVGSLLQMIPVVAGLPLRGPVRLVRWVPPSIGGGSVLLALAFLSTSGVDGAFPFVPTSGALFAAAAALLAGGFALALSCLVPTLLQRGCVAAAADIVRGMRLAAGALAGALTCGLLLAAWLAGGPSLPAIALADVHAVLGLVGWVAVLVVAVSFQVLPMFQATAIYPARLAAGLPVALASSVATWATGRWMEASWRTAVALAAAVPLLAYVTQSMLLLHRRRRGKPSATTAYWYLALASMAGAALLFVLDDDAAAGVAAGVLFVLGFAMSAVNGMLYKIVPFLLWYHLQEHAVPGTRVPKISELVAEARIRTQFLWHAVAVVAGTVACWVPMLARPAGLALAVAGVLLGLDLARPVRRHARASAAAQT